MSNLTTVDLNFFAVAPLITLAVAGLVVLVLELVLPAERSRPWWYAAGLGGIALALYYVALLWSGPAAGPAASIIGAGLWGRVTNGISVFGGAYVVDRFTLLFSGIVLIAAFCTVLLSTARRDEDMPGYVALVLGAALGMCVLAGAGNFLTLFLGLEILSLNLYVAVALERHNAAAKEAALKYLILGALATAAMVYGFAFLYGQTGTMSLSGLARGWEADSTVLMKVGLGLVLLGLAFKLALAPFHVWAPDVYQGATAPITAFMSVGTKAAAFAALVRVLLALMPEESPELLLPLWVLAVASMVVGSLSAAVQTNVKRLLAYSGVAHVGYLMMALLGMNHQGVSAGIFYMAAYLFMNIGAFAVVVSLGKNGREGEELSDFTGLFYRRPGLALAMTLFMLSLAGMPPAAGFQGKLYLVFSALGSGAGGAALWLVGALVVTTGISAYAYLRVVTTMFRRSEAQAELADASHVEAAPAGLVNAGEGGGTGASVAGEGPLSWALTVVVAVAVIGTLYLGVAPQSMLALTRHVLPLP